jgi:hypothetical protein
MSGNQCNTMVSVHEAPLAHTEYNAEWRKNLMALSYMLNLEQFFTPKND